MYVKRKDFLQKKFSNKSIKFVHETLRDKVFLSPDNKIVKWKNTLPKVCEKFECYFELPKSCTTDTKLIYFQYRILNRILATNTFLFKIKLSQTQNCVFCTTEPETLIHVFYECPCVRSFWNDISSWLDCHITNSITLDKTRIILGSKSGTILENHIILICKRYIYSCKLNVKLPIFQEVKEKIKFIRNIEKYIFTKNGKIHEFRKRWLFLSEEVE